MIVIYNIYSFRYPRGLSFLKLTLVNGVLENPTAPGASL